MLRTGEEAKKRRNKKRRENGNEVGRDHERKEGETEKERYFS